MPGPRGEARQEAARAARFAGVAALLLALGCGAAQPRHLVLITLDTFRADHLRSDLTPHLHALAARGARFEDAIAQSISTPPSHASIFTGLNPARHGLRRLVGQALPEETRTLAEILHGAGFRTAAFVSGLPLREESGLDAGFDVYEDHFDAHQQSIRAPETNARVAEWLSDVVPGRLFLWVHYFDPHWRYRDEEGRVPRDLVAPRNVHPDTGAGRPYPPEVVERMEELYRAEVATVDEAVGALLALLEERALLDDTVVAVVADHGEVLGEHGYFFGHWDVYGETARVPMLLAHPRRRYAGASVPQTVRTIDLLPTLLAWLDVSAPEGLDGRDLTPLLDGRERADRAAYTEQLEYFPVRSVRRGDWLLHDRGPLEDEPPHREVKLRPGRRSEAPGEVAAPPPEVVEALEEELARVLGAERSEPRRVPVDEDVAERLRALGYAE